MFLFIFGNNTEKSHKEFKELVASFLEKNKNTEVIKKDEESFSLDFFNDVLKTQSLFGNKILFLGKRVLQNPEGALHLTKNLKEMRDSENSFVFFEESIKKEHLGEIKKYSDGFKEFKKQEKTSKPKGVNLFDLTDIFVLRKKEKTWLLFREKINQGVCPEDIFWKLLWQVKNLLLVKNGGGEKLNPFVFKKAKSASGRFKKEELTRYSSQLIDIYHKSRKGEGDLGVSLEKFILRG